MTSTASLGVAYAVIISTGSWGQRLRIRFRKSYPVMPPKRASVMTMNTVSFASNSSPASADSTASTE
jgi:hypothetical protein